MKLFKKILTVLPLALSVMACDDVDTPDRYIDMGEIKAQRTVLLEDFTGQECVNCPEAHEQLELLEKQYGENLIAVSIHGDRTKMGIPVKQTSFKADYVGLGSEEGSAYLNSFGGITLPKGVCDRSTEPINVDKWAEAIKREIERPTNLKLEVEAKLNNKNIDITTNVLSSADFSGQLHIWIVESNIVARQQTKNGVNKGYKHMNVFRASLSGSPKVGENISVANGQASVKTHSIELRYNDKERWNAENIDVVVFVTEANGAVAQAARTNLVLPN